MHPIELSRYFKVLITELRKIKSKHNPDEAAKIVVSQTVSFFALAYERLRNVVEYRDSHLIRRSAIERILRRRLSMNPAGGGESENLLRELLWARYFDNESLGAEDVERVQAIIDAHIALTGRLTQGQTPRVANYLSEFMLDLTTCEIEEVLAPQDAKRYALFTFFAFQILKQKVKIKDVSDEEKNAAFYVALERSYGKSDRANLRYHLFILSHKPISTYKKESYVPLTSKLPTIFRKIDGVYANRYSDRIVRYVNKQMPPFRILFDLLKRNVATIDTLFATKESLWPQVEQLCREKYEQARSKLRGLAFKAIIYIFLTKMILALILEYPVSKLLFGEVNYVALIVNTIFPPLLMFAIVMLTRIPDASNTRRIFERIINIVDADNSFESTISYIIKPHNPRRPVLIFAFTIFYSLTFIITFGFLYILLSLLHFNVLSQLIFVFFVSVVTFFAHRIRQTAREYQLPEKETFSRPFIDLFFMPILSLGKWLSQGISRLNVFTVIFDFIIEAPFKLIIEVLEEWITFVRQKREEII